MFSKFCSVVHGTVAVPAYPVNSSTIDYGKSYYLFDNVLVFIVHTNWSRYNVVISLIVNLVFVVYITCVSDTNLDVRVASFQPFLFTGWN